MNTIIFCGFSRAGQETLSYLLENGYTSDDILVFTTDDGRNGEFRTFLEEKNIWYTTDSVNKHEAKVSEQSNALLLSIYYPYIIKTPILKAVNYRAMNLHPALLPKFKGCFSAPWVIIEREEETGITYHYIVEAVDEGKTIVQERMPITNEHTGIGLYNDLIDFGVRHFPEAFEKLKEGFEGIEQVGDGSYYPRAVPFDGYIDLSWPREKIHRFIRAMYFPPYKGALLKWNDEEIEFLTPEDFETFAEKNGL